MKAPVRYVFLLLFISLFLYFLVGITTRLNELFNKQSSSDLSSSSSLDFDEFKPRRRVRLRKFKNYIDENHNVDLFDSNSQSSNRSIWKQVSYRSPFGYSHQGHNHHSFFEFAKNCRLSNCFDFSKCKPGDVLRIHIYPDPNELINSGQLYISSTYKKILHIIRQSEYYEPDPKKACIYVTSFDTLDRDPLSIDYQKNLPRFIPVYNGQNHIIFNLYSGSWPAYNEMDFSNFNPGLAMLIKASIRYQDYRPDFDISLPLFCKTHPLRGDTLPIASNQNSLGNNQQKSYSIRHMNSSSPTKFDMKNLLVFKGKRYIYGIGSETRNMLHHLDNKDDILIYTTCKHGKKWKELKDERCNTDNSEYDKFDYSSLMMNSTFCLVPRGRRLGSYRFLEALGSGCIPVVLSNGWVKPFSSVIDWSSVVIDGDERLLLNLPEVLRSISWRKIAKMRSACLKIYDKYFSSIEKIILTTIKILEQRIQSQMSLNSFIWNIMSPGALWFHNEYSNRLADYPFIKSNQLIVPQRKDGFTAIIYINKPISPTIIFRLLKNLSKSEFLAKALILWALPDVQVPKPINESIQLFSSKIVDIEVIVPEIKNVNAKLYPYESIKTSCVLNLEPDSTLTYEELDFAFRVWMSFKNRIVGFVARDHYYDDAKSMWYYTSKWTNQYSIILLDGAFFHKYWAWLYTNYVFNHNLTSNYQFKNSAKDDDKANLIGNYVGNFGRVGDNSENANENTVSASICLDLIFNFLISHVTREPPIKVSQRKKTTNQSFLGLTMSGGTFSDSQKCFQNLLNYTFNYLPLVKSQLRLDPLLFKDSVSNHRKKYRKMEQFT